MWASGGSTELEQTAKLTCLKLLSPLSALSSNVVMWLSMSKREVRCRHTVILQGFQSPLFSGGKIGARFGVARFGVKPQVCKLCEYVMLGGLTFVMTLLF